MAGGFERPLETYLNHSSDSGYMWLLEYGHLLVPC